jgi:DNA modification methylase
MLEKNALTCGDCISLLNDHPAESIELIVADPPYNIGYTYDVYNDKRSDEEYLQWSEDWIGACTRLLTPSGAFWIAIGDEYAAELKLIAQRCGLHLRNWVIWYYTFGVHCKTKFTRSHTHLLYFSRNPDDYTFNADEVRVPSARQLVYGDKRANGTGRVPDNTWILRPQDVGDNGFLPDHSTWYFPRVAGTFKERAQFHGCQLPEQLLGRIIRSCSDPGDTVLDPFTGTGSTLVVAHKLGRNWIGTELSEEYVQHAQARIDAVQPGDALVGAAEPTTSAPRTAVGRRLKPRGLALDEADLVDAFKAVSDSYSVERIVADPVLTAQFIDQCSERRIPGRPSEWCTSLLTLQQSGRSEILANRVAPTLEWEDADGWEFACEMAVRRMFDEGFRSVEQILCDPEAAFRYDHFCRQICPGCSSLLYRLVALKLRTAVSEWQEEHAGQPDLFADEGDVPVQEAEAAEAPAVYMVRAAKRQPAFVGFTFDMRSRIAATRLALNGITDWVANNGTWTIQWHQVPDANVGRAIQRSLVQLQSPRLNWLDSGARQSS